MEQPVPGAPIPGAKIYFDGFIGGADKPLLRDAARLVAMSRCVRSTNISGWVQRGLGVLALLEMPT